MTNFWDVFNGWMAYTVAVGSWHLVGNLVSVGIFVAVAAAITRATFTRGFDLADLFMENGKLGGSKMRLNVTFMVSMWVLVYQTVAGQLTEWLLGAILAAFVFDRMSSRKARPTDTSVVPGPAENSQEGK